MAKDTDNKVVMVTGASSGIGRELCLNLAKHGYSIVAAARRTDRLKSLCDEINGFGFGSGSNDNDPRPVRAVAVELDVSEKSPVIEEAVKRAWDGFGRIDVLVNNAGIRGGVHSSLDWSEEEWEKNIRTNLTGLWLVSKHVCSKMRDAKIKGSVMAVELGVYNIRVNAIAPGIFKSEITEGLMRKEWLKNVATKTVPLRTYGTTDPALTSIVCHLILDSSEYVTGNIFIVDAGATLPGVPIFSSL